MIVASPSLITSQRHRPLIALIMTFATLAAMLATCAKAWANGERFAVIVYAETYANGLEPAYGASQDAVTLTLALRAAGFEVRVFPNATSGEIRQGAYWLSENLTAASDDAFGIYYFIGHGAQIDERAYLLGIDARWSNAFELAASAAAADVITGQIGTASDRTLVMLDASTAHAGARVLKLPPGLGAVEPPGGGTLMLSGPPGMALGRTRADVSPVAQNFAQMVQADMGARSAITAMDRQIRRARNGVDVWIYQRPSNRLRYPSQTTAAPSLLAPQADINPALVITNREMVAAPGGGWVFGDTIGTRTSVVRFNAEEPVHTAPAGLSQSFTHQSRSQHDPGLVTTREPTRHPPSPARDTMTIFSLETLLTSLHPQRAPAQNAPTSVRITEPAPDPTPGPAPEPVDLPTTQSTITTSPPDTATPTEPGSGPGSGPGSRPGSRLGPHQTPASDEGQYQDPEQRGQIQSQPAPHLQPRDPEPSLGAKPSPILVFVHGSGHDIKSAGITAQILARELGFEGTVIAFAWPTLAEQSPLAYGLSQTQAIRSAPDLARVLDILAEDKDRAITVIADGLGARVLAHALTLMANTAPVTIAASGRSTIPSPTSTPPAQRQTILDHAVFVAPDMEQDAFLNAIIAGRSGVEAMTVYVAPQDPQLAQTQAWTNTQTPPAGALDRLSPPRSLQVDVIIVDHHTAMAQQPTLALPQLLGDISEAILSHTPAALRDLEPADGAPLEDTSGLLGGSSHWHLPSDD